MKKFIMMIVGLSLVLTLTGCAEYYKEETVDAVVVSKEYDPSKTERKKVGGKWKTKRKAEEYEVNLEYNGIQLEVEDKKLYNRVKEGSKVKVTYKVGYDEKNQVVSERLIYND